MSVLDAFYVLFKGDNTDLVKKTKESEKVLDDFEKKQKDVEENNNKLASSFLNLSLQAAAVFGSFFAVSKIKDGILATNSYNASIQRTSELTRIAGNDISAWGHALTSVGGNTEEFNAQLLKLNQQYADQGLSVEGILENLKDRWADYFKTLKDSGQQVRAIREAGQLGIDQNTLLLLELGNDELTKRLNYYKQLAPLTQQDLDKARAFETEMASIGVELKGIFTDLEPIIKVGVDGLSNFAKGLHIIAEALNDLFHGKWQELSKLAGLSWLFGGSSQTPAAVAPAGGAALSAQEESRRFWQSKGFSNSQVAALLANEQRESSFDSTRVGDNGTSFGMFQWHDPSRRAAILANTGVDVTKASHADQLRAAAWELDNTGYGDKLRATQSPGAGAGVLTAYENPANAANEALIRGQMADHIAAAQSMINAADNSSLNQPGVSNKSTSVTIENMTINTQATDAAGIASAIHGNLNQQFRLTSGNYDDAIAY